MVIVGQAGLTQSILAETDAALDHHELLKVRVNAADRVERKEMVERICGELGAELVGTIGHIALIFRRNPDNPNIALPRPKGKPVQS